METLTLAVVLAFAVASPCLAFPQFSWDFVDASITSLQPPHVCHFNSDWNFSPGNDPFRIPYEAQFELMKNIPGQGWTPIDRRFVDGSFTVLPPSAVPEPGTLLLLGIPLGAYCLWGWSRARKCA